MNLNAIEQLCRPARRHHRCQLVNPHLMVGAGVRVHRPFSKADLTRFGDENTAGRRESSRCAEGPGPKEPLLEICSAGFFTIPRLHGYAAS